MVSILDFFKTDTGKEFIEKSSKQVGENPDKVKSVLSMGLPMILGAMKKNSKTEEGAENLNKALEEEKHNGSILDNLGDKINELGFLDEGAGILDHVLGGKQSKIAEAVGASTGMDSAKVWQLLKMAAPVVMGILGDQKRKDDVGKKGISGLIGSVMGSNSSHDQSMLETFMDADGDGSMMDDMAGKLFGGKGKSKGLGGLF